MKKITHKELEEEKIAIEKQAKKMYSCMPSSQCDAYLQELREERRVNLAENEDLVEEISKYVSRKQKNNKSPNIYNTGLPTLVAAWGGLVATGILISAGVLPSGDGAEEAGQLLAGLAAGGITGLVNSLCYCTKPITKVITQRQINKRQRKLDANTRRNNAISYLEECLKKNEAEDSNEFTDEDYFEALRNTEEMSATVIDDQVDDDEMVMGHA